MHIPLAFLALPLKNGLNQSLLCADHLASTGLNHTFATGTRKLLMCCFPRRGGKTDSHSENQCLLSCVPRGLEWITDTALPLTLLLYQCGQPVGWAALHAPCSGCVSPWQAAPATNSLRRTVRVPTCTPFAQHASLRNRPSLFLSLFYHWFHLDRKHPSINK